MASRYSAEFLLHLRQSPLCVKPPNLPPPEEWMGPPPETFRNQQKTTNDRLKSGDGVFLNQENRRPPQDRNGPRNASNSEDIILGPPRTSFASATSMRNSRGGDTEKGFRDSDRQDRADRFNFRGRGNDPDSAGDRFGRDGRDTRNNGFRRRGDQDNDSDGWSTVKPRKSFGHEGAERFQGRMGAAGANTGTGGNDRFGDRRLRDRDDREGGERRARAFGHRSRDHDGDDTETPRRNGPGRGKSDSWFRDANTGSHDGPMSQRERIEKAKSWRDRDPEDKPGDRHGDRNDRHYERRWDRDRHARAENEPEWMDEPAEEKGQAHTEEDFKKFMESMKAARGAGAPKPEAKPDSVSFDKPTAESVAEAEQKVVSAPALELGPDKFFATYGGSSLDAGTPSAEAKDAAKPKAGKSSRFMAFLAPQEDSRAKTEPTTPAAGASAGGSTTTTQQSDAEKEAFALLIQKLQRSGGLGATSQSGAAPPPPPQPAPNRFHEQPPFQEPQRNSAVTSPEPFQQYGNNDRRDDSRIRTSQQAIHDIISPRPVGLPVQPPPVSRPEQALQDLLAQRHNLPPNQTSARAAQNVAAVNSNTEYLMRLMQSHRDAPDPPRPEQLLALMAQPPKQGAALPNFPDREQEYQRERSASQRQQLRGSQGGQPGGFFDENQFRPGEVDARPPPQPTQILQRPPPPPGLDHQMHPFHMGGMNPAAAAAAGQLPPQRGPMIPPPGLLNNGPRNVPMPGMYPPNFPPPPSHAGPGGSFPPPGPHPPLPHHAAGGPPPPPHPGPPDGMVGPPPRSMPPPPPGFFGSPPPPGFMGPLPGMGGGPPDGHHPPPPGPPPPNAGGPGPGGMGGAGFGVGGMPGGPFERLEQQQRMGAAAVAAMDARRGIMPPGTYRGP